jgi:putative phosphoesterase
MEERKIKVGVISDTHLTGYDEKLKKIVDEHFGDVDFVIHAGDLVDLRVLDIFEGKEVKAVCGNMDYFSVREKLPEQLLLGIKGFNVGIIHGWGDPGAVERKIAIKLGNLDCIIYGHTHQPVNHLVDGILFFNPGSPTDRRFAAYRSIGILEIDKKVSGKIIKI